MDADVQAKLNEMESLLKEQRRPQIRSTGYTAEDFVAGIPSATLLGILSGAAATVAVAVGFLPTTFGTVATTAAVAGLIFVSEMVRVAYKEKRNR